MNFVYACPKCKSIYTKPAMLPDETMICPDCKDRLVYLKYVKEDWDLKSAEEKTAIKNEIIAEKIHKAADPDVLMLEKFAKIEDHLSVIKGILVFFTVLAVFGLFFKTFH